MKFKNKNIAIIMIVVSTLVFILALIFLIFGDELDRLYNVIGIRVATLFIAFASFCSSTSFSLLVYLHNKTVTRINDDTNRRAEMFRELQFASSNYSIIEFMDRMLIYDESTRYIEKYIFNKRSNFHMFLSTVNEEDVFVNPSKYLYISLKIPFKVVEGKVVSMITFEKLKFERNGENFSFISSKFEQDSRAFILYNEHTKRNNVIINLIVPSDSDFFISSKVNVFSKIKININITSLLGVKVKGVSELYFTNPEQIEGDGTNTYKINSSNFTISEMPKISSLPM